MTAKKTRISRFGVSVFILILFHVIGICGVLFGDAATFLMLTPMNLLLTLALVLFNHKDWQMWWVFALTFVLGFLAEVVGVNTGFPFGEYSYGPVLGFQLWNTPLMIGVNWLILLYGANAIGARIGLTPIVKALAAAALMVMLDYFIEPVAIRYDFWTWELGWPPMANYLGWFGVAFLLSLLWQITNIRLNKSMGIAVFATEWGFFLVLQLLG